MLTALTIKNYALIDKLHVDFNNGLTIITGETGAGKSILLGGLSLILGKRADLSSLKDASQKCVIEAVFDISNYNLKALFKSEDFDYDSQTIIRREILPSGKSRAFVNDSPVNLNGLQRLGNQLVDIHSQHETLQLINDDFQFQVIDALANNSKNLETYKEQLQSFKVLKKEIEGLIALQSEATKELDYNSFLLNELNEINLTEVNIDLLEEEYASLNNVEDIKEQLKNTYQLLSRDEIGVIQSLTEIKSHLSKISSFGSKYDAIYNRINSSLIEIDDIFGEIENLEDQLVSDPSRLETVNTKLQILNDLMKKHVVNSISELIEIKAQLEEKVAVTESLEETISKKQEAIITIGQSLDDLAETIHHSRKESIPVLIKALSKLLANLGMPNAQFKIDVSQSNDYYLNGKDLLSFLFSANKGGNFQELKKAASGGELSRIMLSIKSILSQYKRLPTIMFDEIDSGVSGEISNKMADIMLGMSKTMQVFTITHLPQIAAKGHSHFKVFKEDIDDITRTDLVKLNHDERIVEIAQMLGGISMSNSAIAHAKELLN